MTIDWAKQRGVRGRAAENKDHPLVYLLLPEMVQLINCIDDPRQKMLFMTLWYSGAKVSEILALKVGDVRFHKDHVCLAIKGRRVKSRIGILIYDSKYGKALKKYIAENRLSAKELLWKVTRQTVARWLKAILAKKNLAKCEYQKYSVTLFSFRHSFAINWLLHSSPVHMLVEIMDFKQPDSAAQYVKYLSYDAITEYKRVRFS